MHVVPSKPTDFASELAGLPLVVVLADGESIAAVREKGEGVLALVPPFHVSDDDVYLVLPEDVGVDFVEMFADGDVDLLEEAMRDGLVAVGVVEKEGRGKVALHVERCGAPAELLRTMPYAQAVGGPSSRDALAALNEIECAQCTVASALADEAGFARMVQKTEHAGPSWKPPRDRKDLAHVDPTYAWTKRQKDGRIGIEAALFVEYEEWTVVLRPAVIAAPTPRLALASAP